MPIVNRSALRIKCARRKLRPRLQGSRGGRGGAQGAQVGALAEAELADALAGGVVEEDAVLLAGPDRVVLQQVRALHLEEQAAGPAAADDQRLPQRCLLGVKVVGPAQG